jgi:DNA-binding HxlR family transcriptional regulator
MALSPHQTIVLCMIAERDGSDKYPFRTRMELFNELTAIQAGLFKQTLDNILRGLEQRGLIERILVNGKDRRGRDSKLQIQRATAKGSEAAQALVATGRLEQAQRVMEARLRA